MQRPSRRPGHALAPAVVATAVWLVALVLGGGSPTPVPTGLPDPGPLVAWGSRLAELAALLCAVVAVGSLLVASPLVPTDAHQGPLGRAVRRATAWWSVALVAGAVAERADSLGVPVTALGPTDLLDTSAPAAQAVLVGQVVALVCVGRALPRTTSGPGRVLLLGAALAVAVATAVQGHQATADEVLVGGLVVHVVAALVWTGGLAGLVLHLRADLPALARAVPRYSRLALACYVAVALSGLLAVARILGTAPDAWRTGYAGLVATKAALLVVLGLLGVLHRRRSLPSLRAGRPLAFARLATGELVVMGSAAGLAAALARTPVPGPTGAAAGHGHRAGDVLPDLTWAGTWSQSRPNPVVLLVLVAALGCYLSGARSWRGAGRSWPRARTAAFVGATGLALVATSSGLAVQAHVRPSVLVAQLLVVLLLVPALALAGRPWLLLTGSGAARVAAAPPPAAGALAVCALLLAVQYSPVLEVALASPWWHLALLLAACACGTLLWWPVLGPGAGSDRSRLEDLGWPAVVVVAVAVLAARLGTGSALLAPDWFLETRLRGADPLADQRAAAVVAACAAVALGVALVLLARHRTHEGSRTRPSAQAGPTGPGGHILSSTVPRSDSDPMAP